MVKSKKNDKKFLFSVVIPVYNVEDYLEEAIESVINQSIGFEKNIQLILVNDGSPDNSEEICLKYKDLYPNNVIYIKQKNAGVSAARNNGLKHAIGKYINFLDSDDIWDTDVFQKVYNMFESNDDLDVIAVRIKFFGALDKYHVLDYKFDKDKIVDVNEEYNHIQLSSASCFMRYDAIKNLRYDENLKFSEDLKILSEMLINNHKLGLIASSLYNYRRRPDETSAIQKKETKKSWYIDTPKLCYKFLFDLSIKKYGYVIPYIQYCVAYDYQWRVKEPIPVDIYDDVIEEYLSISKDLLKYIDPSIIIDQKKLAVEYKVFILKEKFGQSFDEHISVKDGAIYFDDIKFYNICNKHVLNITNLKINQDKLILNGLIKTILDPSNFKIILSVDGKDKILKLEETKHGLCSIFNKPFYCCFGFKEVISISQGNCVSIYLEYKGERYLLIQNFSIFAKLNRRLPLRYVFNGHSIRSYKDTILVRKNNCWQNVLEEITLYLKLLKRRKIKPIIYRLCYNILKLFKRKDIWLVSDRVMVANDNGMHLFKYITSHNKIDNVYFVLNKKSDDYKKMKKIGKVINFGSFKYKLYFLLSKYVISSHADMWVYNPFDKDVIYYTDLFKFNFVFLQHGIIKDDLSKWLNIYAKDFSIFVTSVKGEYDSIVNNEYYGYGKDIVKLTGLPRFDNLSSEPKKQIAIMPTWRKSAANALDGTTGTRKYNEAFKNTEYCKFYNALINDERLLKVMREKGYTGLFVVHPSHVENHIDFKGNDVFEINAGYADYQKIFRESDLLVSDYSSVPFDFAYMKKPVVYSQFDRESFFSSHTYTEGYFDYEENGFGPVCYGYESSVNAIIEYIKNGCVMEHKYKSRVNSFFSYTDKNNCERVYKEILNLSKPKKKTK